MGEVWEIMMLGRDMGPTVQVDIVLVQHLLNFWDGRGADILPILRALGISEFGPLPPWIAADKLREAQNRVEQQFTGSLIAAQSGRYLAEHDLPMGRLMRVKTVLFCTPVRRMAVRSVMASVSRHWQRW